jgi:hypothetical protein
MSGFSLPRPEAEDRLLPTQSRPSEGSQPTGIREGWAVRPRATRQNLFAEVLAQFPDVFAAVRGLCMRMLFSAPLLPQGLR